MKCIGVIEDVEDFVLFFTGNLLAKDRVIEVESHPYYFSVTVPDKLFNAVASNSELLTDQARLAEFMPYIEDALYDAMDDYDFFETRIPNEFSDTASYVREYDRINHFKPAQA